MLTLINKTIALGTLLCMLSLFTNSANAATDPAKTYKHHGYISYVDQINRLITIDNKVYKAAVGMKLENTPRNSRYSGVKFLGSDMNVYFNVEPGTEKNSIPTITKMWIEPN